MKIINQILVYVVFLHFVFFFSPSIQRISLHLDGTVHHSLCAQDENHSVIHWRVIKERSIFSPRTRFLKNYNNKKWNISNMDSKYGLLNVFYPHNDPTYSNRPKICRQISFVSVFKINQLIIPGLFYCVMMNDLRK